MGGRVSQGLEPGGRGSGQRTGCRRAGGASAPQHRPRAGLRQGLEHRQEAALGFGRHPRTPGHFGGRGKHDPERFAAAAKSHWTAPAAVGVHCPYVTVNRAPVPSQPPHLRAPRTGRTQRWGLAVSPSLHRRPLTYGEWGRRARAPPQGRGRAVRACVRHSLTLVRVGPSWLPSGHGRHNSERSQQTPLPSWPPDTPRARPHGSPSPSPRV